MADERLAPYLPFCIFNFAFYISSYFFGEANHRHTHSASLTPTLGILYQACNLSSDLCLDNFFPALRAYSRRHILYDDQRFLNPEVLLDSSLLHLLAADAAFAVIIPERYSHRYTLLTENNLVRSFRLTMNEQSR